MRSGEAVNLDRGLHERLRVLDPVEGVYARRDARRVRLVLPAVDVGLPPVGVLAPGAGDVPLRQDLAVVVLGFPPLDAAARAAVPPRSSRVLRHRRPPRGPRRCYGLPA